MAETESNRDTLNWNFKFLSHNTLDGFGGIGGSWRADEPQSNRHERQGDAQADERAGHRGGRQYRHARLRRVDHAGALLRKGVAIEAQVIGQVVDPVLGFVRAIEFMEFDL